MSGPNIYLDVLEQAHRRPEHLALWHSRPGSKVTGVTYAQLAAMAQQFAAGFAQHAADNRIIPLFLSKSPQCVAAMLGAVGAGKAFACLNRKLRWPQIQGILRAVGPSLALVDGVGAQTLAAGQPDRSTRWRLVDDAPLSPPQKKAVDKLRREIDLQPWPGDLAVAVSPLPDASPAAASQPEQTAACCLFTSGSTGNPKGVLISQSDLRARAAAEIAWFGLGPDDVLLSVLPFSFDVGLNQLLSALLAGCSLVLMDSWLPADILRAVAQFKVTGISGVPAIWSDMFNADMCFQTGRDASSCGPHASLNYLTLSGGDLPHQLLMRLPQLAPGVGIFKTYGQSEAFRAASLRPQEFAARPTSVGRAFTGVRLYIVRPDASLCDPGEEGEIVHTGLGVMLGYLGGGDAEQKQKLRPNPFAGPEDSAALAVFTGDLGYIDAEGYLFVKGRRDAMLKIAGNRVYPREVVEQILAAGGAQEAEVVGVKTDDGATQLVAFVVLAAGAARAVNDLHKHWATRLPTYMMPRLAVALERIPRTANGKPDTPALMQQARKLLDAAP